MSRTGPAFFVLLAVATALVTEIGTTVAATPATSRLTFTTWIAYGSGTGAISSPAAFCEANADGSALDRLSDRIGLLGDPAWTRDGARLAFTIYDPVTHTTLLQVTAGDRWSPRTVVRGPVGWPAWSPDGRRIAYVSSAAARPGLYVVNADGTGGRLLFAGSAAAPSWSADGARIAFEADGIRTIGADGTGRVRLTDDGATPAWSPDGMTIAFVTEAPGATAGLTEQELSVISAGGTGRRQVSHLVESGASPIATVVGRPAWAPDGSMLAVARTVILRGAKGQQPLSHDAFLVDPGGSGQTKLLSLDGIGDPAWRPAAALTGADTTRRPCTIRGTGTSRTIRGTAYDDLIVGGDAGEAILGGAGSDWIHAGGGRDTITGGPGRDEIWTGRGSDTVLVRDGARDLVHCGEGGSDIGTADRSDKLLGSCRRVEAR